MKKLSLLLAVVLVLSFSVLSHAQYIDGTYEGWGDAGDKSICYAKVFIEDGKIVGVILREFNDRMVEKDWTTYPWPQAAEAARTLGLQFVENQAAKADIITGATGSSTGYIQAVERALIKASPNKPNQKYFDGVFMGRSDVASRGYAAAQLLTFEKYQGWFFWSYRTETTPAWSLRTSVERGWLPSSFA